jgi:uncharacterized protein
MTEADRIIAHLKLRPHPEGGHYRETFRDARTKGRAHSTAIYFLLKRGEASRLHRLDAYTLVGCTVAPGFEFAGFEMAET